MVNAPGNMHQGGESRSTTNQLAYRVMSGKKKKKACCEHGEYRCGGCGYHRECWRTRSSLSRSSSFFFASRPFAEFSSSRLTLCFNPDGPSKGINLESKRWTSAHRYEGSVVETNRREEGKVCERTFSEPGIPTLPKGLFECL